MIVEKLTTYNILFPGKNMVLTDWDGENILDFSFAKIQMRVPLNYDYSNVYEITNEECEELENKQLEKLRQLDNERKNR